MRNNIKLRIAALIALLILIIVLISSAILLLRNIGFAITMVLTLSFMGYGSWLSFTGTKHRSVIGKTILGLGFIVVILELFYFIQKDKIGPNIITIAILLGSYYGIVKILRHEYWHEKRREAELQHNPPQFSKPFLIINPKSGNGRAIKANIEKLASDQGIHVLVTKKGDDIESLARKVVADGADVLGISGGDGSIGAVAKVALEYDLPMVVLPGGTRCHFARDLGLDPLRIADSLAAFKGVERRLDVGNINGRIFLNNASFGLYADIVSHEEYRDNKLGISQKVLRSIMNDHQDLYDLQFEHGDKHYDKALQVLVGVNAYNTVNITELGHRTELDGGVLQITAITKLSDQMVKELVKPISLNKLEKLKELNVLDQWETDSFTVTSQGDSLKVGVDGESEEYKNPVTINIMAKSLRIFVPAEGLRGRPKSIFSRHIISRLWNYTVHGKIDKQ